MSKNDGDIECGKAHAPITPLGSMRMQSKAALLQDVPMHARISVEFLNLNAFVPIIVAPGAGQKASKDANSPKDKQILFDTTACVEPGELLALMGPSGSGKSSLITLLGGRSTARWDGSITFNGAELSKPIKRKLGYVSQDDLLFAELTVYETLYFAALLRLPKDWPREKKLDRVEMVLQGLGLVKCRDTIIGNHMMRGVSGGERKRVSIGHELLINPSVMFLDEPTSGLDSTTALQLLHTLRTLASGGRTIITSIHQPSSRLYQQMDKLLLLSEGYTVYYGDAHVCSHWLAKYGQPVPFGVSTADHLLDLACGDLPGHTRLNSQEILMGLRAAFKERVIGLSRHGIQPDDLGKEAVAAFKANDLSRNMALAGLIEAASSEEDVTSSPASQSIELQNSRPTGGNGSAGSNSSKTSLTLEVGEGGVTDAHVGIQATHHTSAQKGSELAEVEVVLEELEVQDSKWGASWFDQIKILTSRSLRTRRFSALSTQRIIEIIAISLLSGLFWWQRGAGSIITDQAASDVGGLLFFELLYLSFSTLFQAIFSYPSEFAMLVKERQSGMYRLSAYYLARTASDLPMDCLLPTAMCWILYFMGGLRLSAAAFFGNWWAVMLGVLLAQSSGLLIGATIMNIKNCLTISSVTMLTLMLVGGFYVRGVPIWIDWLKYLSYIYWGWNLLLKIEFNGQEMVAGSCPGLPANQTCSVSQSGIFQVDVDQPATAEAFVLVGMLVVMRIATYYALNRKTKFKSG
ncbi:hypothetical protein CEUSTIGMA_g3961.t1 [Chlamydomonas eustigma]|uniref:ABC transporter domain-containing protein n=1 Tax=Chlamydomonas eustigma TaxID=1157962 RepID=A0A250X0E1_9CHLO|nr:hypothetical protein CEUSTIGMA_g3961.t1 [Chlamydomonas eustigma]|eukprot:GAX76515.1 hypothetical protein CEUSTIGMA_g3961.t1 [Chlamydomonas eustigma]